MRLRVCAALVLSVLAGSAASAATLNRTGSVRSSIATGYDGSVTYRGNSAFGNVKFLASSNGSDLRRSSGYGFGINCPSSVSGCSADSAHQIDTPEVLTVRFEQRLFLTSVDIAMLSTRGSYCLRVDETGSILGSGFDINFDSDNANRNGLLTVAVNRRVPAIRFVSDAGEWNDFTLARRRIDETRLPAPLPGSPIPEPSSVLLMLAGAGIVASQMRRHI